MQNEKPVDQKNKLLPVIVTLVDGETLKGSISVARSKSLGDVLNGTDLFILFQVTGGELIYLAQKTIAAVQSNQLPTAGQLDKSKQQLDHDSPHEILNIEQGAGKAAARDAYHALIKRYHPDQFASSILPSEIQDYLEAVIHRLNAAYNDFLDETDRLEKLKQLKARQQQQQKTGTRDISYFGQ